MRLNKLPGTNKTLTVILSPTVYKPIDRSIESVLYKTIQKKETTMNTNKVLDAIEECLKKTSVLTVENQLFLLNFRSNLINSLTKISIPDLTRFIAITDQLLKPQGNYRKFEKPGFPDINDFPEKAAEDIFPPRHRDDKTTPMMEDFPPPPENVLVNEASDNRIRKTRGTR